MINFNDNSFISNTYSATGEKLSTAYGIRMAPVLSPLSSGETAVLSTRDGGISGDDPGTPEPQAGQFRHYCGNVVYDMGVTRLLTGEGYVTFASDGTPQYHYYLRDHLGNVRVVMDQSGSVEQVNHYYAFGGLMRESSNPGVQPYKYGGKELDRSSGLDAYDFGARSYFADRMQWSTMDPLCEKYYDVTPYGYCHNDPVNRLDAKGKDDYILTSNGFLHLYMLTPNNTHTIYSTSMAKITVNKEFLDNHFQAKALGRGSDSRGCKISLYRMDIYSISKDDGQKLFQFLSSNTNVEWSHVRVESQNGKIDYLGTSHSESDDASLPYIVDLINPKETTVYEANHSHSFLNSIPSPGDIKNAKKIHSTFPNSVLHIYDKGFYYKYDEYTKTDLPEVEIIGKKRDVIKK